MIKLRKQCPCYWVKNLNKKKVRTPHFYILIYFEHFIAFKPNNFYGVMFLKYFYQLCAILECFYPVYLV